MKCSVALFTGQSHHGAFITSSSTLRSHDLNPFRSGHALNHLEGGKARLIYMFLEKEEYLASNKIYNCHVKSDTLCKNEHSLTLMSLKNV